VNRILLSWTAGAGLRAVSAFEQDLACVNILDYDLVPAEQGDGVEIERRLIKGVNMTPYNPTKFGMNMTSLEAIFARVPG
jgi:probable phosphoglycerate mutase